MYPHVIILIYHFRYQYNIKSPKNNIIKIIDIVLKQNPKINKTHNVYINYEKVLNYITNTKHIFLFT